MTKLIAITGGIGSGKSTFSNEIKKRGFKLLDSDEKVSQIYEKPSKKFLNYLKKINLGQSIKYGKVDKKYISKKIFTDKRIKTKLEKFIFAIVRDSRKNFIQKEKNRKTKLVFFDIPLLFENKLNKDFDIIISIISSKKNRYQRLVKSRKISKHLFYEILKNQTTDIERKKNSDIVIFNNNNIKAYINKINKIIDNKIL